MKGGSTKSQGNGEARSGDRRRQGVWENSSVILRISTAEHKGPRVQGQEQFPGGVGKAIMTLGWLQGCRPSHRLLANCAVYGCSNSNPGSHSPGSERSEELPWSKILSSCQSLNRISDDQWQPQFRGPSGGLKLFLLRFVACRKGGEAEADPARPGPLPALLYPLGFLMAGINSGLHLQHARPTYLMSSGLRV